MWLLSHCWKPADSNCYKSCYELLHHPYHYNSGDCSWIEVISQRMECTMCQSTSMYEGQNYTSYPLNSQPKEDLLQVDKVRVSKNWEKSCF